MNKENKTKTHIHRTDQIVSYQRKRIGGEVDARGEGSGLLGDG